MTSLMSPSTHGDGFVFVTFDNPCAHEDEDIKKIIRSQAATHSHRVAPRKGARHARYQARHVSPRAEIPKASPDARLSPSGAPKKRSRTGPVRPPATGRLGDKPSNPQAPKRSRPSSISSARKLSLAAPTPSPALVDLPITTPLQQLPQLLPQ